MEPNTSVSRLRELQGSGYEIVDGQPNIIGWTIKDRDNYRIGVVDDLLFDPEQQKVRYIIANLKNNEFNLDKRKVLIPIGIAELHETQDDVIVPLMASWQLRALPTYGQRMTDYDERDIYTVFSTGSEATIQQQEKHWQKPRNFYDNPTYNHDNLYKKRRKAEQKDTPIERTFKVRHGGASNKREDGREIETNTGQRMSEKSPYEPESTMVHNDINRSSDADNMRQNMDTENDRVLNRLKRMHDELYEIERDLRGNRDTR